MHGSLVGSAGALLTELGVPLAGAGEGGQTDPSGIVDFHRQVLAASLGSGEGWLNWGASSRIDRRALASTEQAALDAISGVTSAGMRGWAEPRSALLLDWLDDQSGGSAFILAYRPPWDVQAGLEHTGLSPDVVLSTWTLWNKAILDFFDRHDDRCVLIEGGSVVSDPVALVAAVESLGIAMGPCRSARDRAAWIWTAAARAADRRQVRRRADLEPVHKLLDGLPVEARLLLGELDRRAAAVDTCAPPPLTDLVPEPPGRSAAGSVVVTCRDDGWLLIDALASVRCCREEGVEAVVVDRGSTDLRTIETLDALEKAGVSVVRITSSNRAEARNTGMAATVSPFVVFLEPPDLLRPGFITEAASRVAASPRLATVHCGTQRRGDEGPRPASGDLAGQIGRGGGGVRREAAWDVGGFDTELRADGVEQFDLDLALVAAGWEIAKLDAVGFDCRPREDDAATTQVSGASTPMGQVIAKHRALFSASPRASLELLEAADAVLAVANVERDRAIAALVDARERLADLTRRSQADLATSNALAAAAETRIAAMGRQARSLEERVADITDEVARREQAAETARARAATEHALRLDAIREAERGRQECARLAAEISAIHATKLWRWSAGPRHVYRLLRRRFA